MGKTTELVQQPYYVLFEGLAGKLKRDTKFLGVQCVEKGV